MLVRIFVISFGLIDTYAETTTVVPTTVVATTTTDTEGSGDSGPPSLGCPEKFATADMLYCNGNCGDDWLDDVYGCQQTDADAYCKLKLCDENAFASSFDVTTATNKPGFACDGYGKSYGNWFGMKGVYFEGDVLENHGPGEVVSNVVCKTLGCNELYRCANAKCIPTPYKCDGDDDCGDGSDEQCVTCADYLTAGKMDQCNNCTSAGNGSICTGMDAHNNTLIGACMVVVNVTGHVTDGMCDVPECTDDFHCFANSNRCDGNGLCKCGNGNKCADSTPFCTLVAGDADTTRDCAAQRMAPTLICSQIKEYISIVPEPNIYTITEAKFRKRGAKITYGYKVGATHIFDGGDDMYDKGNYINVPKHPHYVKYLEDCNSGSVNGQDYSMDIKRDGFSVTVFSPYNKKSISITGELGADNQGSVYNGSCKHNGWTGFWKTVYGAPASDPGINHLYVTDATAPVHKISSDTNNDDDTLSNVSGSNVVYLMWATQHPNKSSDSVMQQLVEAVSKGFIVDCDWGKWTTWSNCTAQCGDGTVTRSRNITQDALYGGENCTGDSREDAQCIINDCLAKSGAVLSLTTTGFVSIVALTLLAA